MKTKQELLDIMRSAGVKEVEIQYNGSGDEGGMTEVLYTMEDGAESNQLHPTDNASADPLWDDWESLHDRALEASGYDGYWNNDGGGGSMTLDVASGSLTVNHYYYETVQEDCDTQEVEIL